jgi:hypothetical protein
MDRKTQLMAERDEHLEEIAQGAHELHDMVRGIGEQVDQNMVVIEETGVAVDGTQKKLNFVMGKLGHLLKTDNNKTLWTILMLMGILCFQILLLVL